MIMTREMEIELAQRCSDPYDAFHWRGNKYFYWPFVWINYSLNCHLRIFIIITLRERERERERDVPAIFLDVEVIQFCAAFRPWRWHRWGESRDRRRPIGATVPPTRPPAAPESRKINFIQTQQKKIQKSNFEKFNKKSKNENFENWNQKSKNMKYFESDGTAGIADDVDDVLAAGILHVLPVHFEQPVAGQQGNVHLLVTGHRFGEDHRPLNNTP